MFKRLFVSALCVMALTPVSGAQEHARSTAPVLIKEVKPEYTKQAKEAGIEGTVVLDAVVRKDGTVSDVKVTKSLDTKYGLDEQAITCVKQWRFKPGTKDGNPVDVRVGLEVYFGMRR